MAMADTFERDGLEMSWAARSDVGNVRQVNEDGYLAEGGLFVVADGMGGHAAGDVASRLTVERCRDAVPALPLALDDVEKLVADANTVVWDHATSIGPQGMGTTIVGLVWIDNAGESDMAVFNVGDSRCYSFDARSGLVRVTHDHSLVQELVDTGAISAGDADSHPERNVVTRAIGVEPAVAADFFVLPRHVTRVLLCSDGVSGELDEMAIERILRESADPATAVDDIIDGVLDGRAGDNATAIVVDVVSGEVATRGDDVADEITGPRPGDNQDEQSDEDTMIDAPTIEVPIIDAVPGTVADETEGEIMEPAQAPIAEVPQ